MITRMCAATAIAAAAAITVSLPGTAWATGGGSGGRQVLQLDCQGSGPVTIVTTPTVVHDAWNAAQIEGGGHFVPVAFTYLAYDETAGIVLDDETVAHPSAHNQQETTTCIASQTAQLADIAPPGTSLPPGVAWTDTVTTSFIATVVAKP
jgi:hypothetical protein